MAILDSFDKSLLKTSLRHFLVVLGFFVFAIALDISIRFCETWRLVSSQIADGMASTALFIFQADRFMIYYMVAMAVFRLMVEYTVRLWKKPL